MTGTALLSLYELTANGLPRIRIDQVPLFDVAKTLIADNASASIPVKDTVHEAEHAGIAQPYLFYYEHDLQG